MSNYITLLNHREFQTPEYLEVAETALASIDWQDWNGTGILEGLRFNWNNGISTGRYAEGSGEQTRSIKFDSMIKKIIIDYNNNVTKRMRFYNNKGCLIG